MYSDRRERIIFLSAANATFAVPDSHRAGRHMVYEESSSHKDRYWLCDLRKFSDYVHHFPAQLEMQDGKKN